MHWVIDIGNTHWKLGIFHGNEKLHEERLMKEEVREALPVMMRKYPVERGIVAATGHFTPQEYPFFDREKWLILEHGLKLNFNNLYRHPEKLGADRMALAAAAVSNFPDRRVLVIDAGTCITYDYIDEQARYHGGAISPGIQSRYRAMHDYTAGLPLLTKKTSPPVTGDDTYSSMHSGVVNGVIFEIEGMIEAYHKKAENDCIVVLTGGDSGFLANQLKSSIFVRPDFLLEGLNVILKINS